VELRVTQRHYSTGDASSSKWYLMVFSQHKITFASGMQQNKIGVQMSHNTHALFLPGVGQQTKEGVEPRGVAMGV